MAIITVIPGTNAIQNAVTTASPGDVILVNNGVYNEVVTIITNNIRIVAASTKVFLDGTNTLGIAFTLNGVTGVEINGFNIANYTIDGINLNGSSNYNLITRNKITNIGEDGINIDSGSGNLILSNTVQNSGGAAIIDSGIELEDANNWAVNNTVRGNIRNGITVTAGSNGVIGNTSSNNSGTGLKVSSVFNILESNTISVNKNNGLVLDAGADENFIFKNAIRSNRPNNIVNNGIDNNFLQNR